MTTHYCDVVNYKTDVNIENKTGELCNKYSAQNIPEKRCIISEITINLVGDQSLDFNLVCHFASNPF